MDMPAIAVGATEGAITVMLTVELAESASPSLTTNVNCSTAALLGATNVGCALEEEIKLTLGPAV
jgi:hypothetical protein